MENKQNLVTLYDEDGNEYELEILYSCDSDDGERSYVFLVDPKNPEDVIPMRHNKELDRFDVIEDEDELAEVEEIFETLEENPKVQDLKKN